MRPGVSFSLLLLFASVWMTSLQAEPPTPTLDSQAVAVVRKAAAGAEVHGVGIAQPVHSGFGSDDVKSWTQLVDLLRRKEGPAGRIWEALPKKTQEFATNNNLVGKLEDPSVGGGDVLRLKIGVGTTIDGLLARSDFYTEKAFKGVPLDKYLQDLLALGEKRTRIQTLRMNRELLARAFPEVITPVPANYLVTPVHVKVGKPVILVLSASQLCQWQVEVEEGGSVVGIILCGHGPQEVAGIKAPVVYRSGVGPDGKSRWDRKEEVIWSCHDRSDKSFTEMEASVKKITGQPFNSFQGQHNAPKGGFVVKPSAK